MADFPSGYCSIERFGEAVSQILSCATCHLGLIPVEQRLTRTEARKVVRSSSSKESLCRPKKSGGACAADSGRRRWRREVSAKVRRQDHAKTQSTDRNEVFKAVPHGVEVSECYFTV
ncbi:uncharacterized protein UMAG_03047 [Mycosarcoma maydis]|uniref:Uncharacterized protein n=1 Tax=Mycosarcoma maydis TaxID=5270 RepID=A0A0D1CR91_MYCMD|nr:uncharacterized protein UMAG_03047 [Ustilago maydis 521]KIS69068.1 hypothetical protein UMAG_03047 [Ustilago maydis 521]|eukprot:XP_011389420.1 hypothetical protein UMAG_03047 [Ustilago maydis 521]